MVQGAHVLILSPDSKLILQHRHNKPGTVGSNQVTAWGGGVEPGEQPMEAAIRELKEELGLDVQASDLTFWRTYRKTKEKHGANQEVHLFVLGHRIDPQSLTVYEGQGYYLVGADDDLDEVSFTPLAREFVPDFFQEGKHLTQAAVADAGGAR